MLVGLVVAQQLTPIPARIDSDRFLVSGADGPLVLERKGRQLTVFSVTNWQSTQQATAPLFGRDEAGGVVLSTDERVRRALRAVPDAVDFMVSGMYVIVRSGKELTLFAKSQAVGSIVVSDRRVPFCLGKGVLYVLESSSKEQLVLERYNMRLERQGFAYVKLGESPMLSVAYGDELAQSRGRLFCFYRDSRGAVGVAQITKVKSGESVSLWKPEKQEREDVGDPSLATWGRMCVVKEQVYVLHSTGILAIPIPSARHPKR